jgi:hypothetical protein
MSLTPGLSAAIVANTVMRDLREDGHEVRSTMRILRYFNEAQRDLAREAGAFRRTEVMPAVSAQVEYALASYPERVLRALFNNSRIKKATAEELDANTTDYPAWRAAAGTPTRWLNDNSDRISLTPQLASAGDALTGTLVTSITAAAGYRITGHGYWRSAGDIFFLPEDGTVTNLYSGSNLLIVEYCYMPEDLGGGTIIPNRFIQALSAFAKARALVGNAAADRYMQQYVNERTVLATGIIDPSYDQTHYRAVQDAIANGQPVPKMMLDDYERIVHKAMEEGDPTGQTFQLGTAFLMQAVQQAAAEGRTIPKEINTAFARYKHDFNPYFQEFAATMDFQWMKRQMKQAMIAGTPLPSFFMEVMETKRHQVNQKPVSRSLEGEVYGGASGYNATTVWG